MLSVIFIFLTTHYIFGGYVCPECYNMIWGFIYGKEGKPARGVKVKFEQAKTSTTLETYSDEKGIYSFNFYKNSCGYAKISIDSGTTVFLEKWKAIRLDFRETRKDCYEPGRSGYSSKIVYITETNNIYHKYGCYYLYNGCNPVPLEYILPKGYKACEKCKP